MPSFYALDSVALTAALTIFLIVITYVGFKRSAWLGPRRIIQMQNESEGSWALVTADGRAIETELNGQTRLYRHWQWLAFASGQSVLIGPGDLSADQQRVLRIVLRRRTSARSTLEESVA